MDKKKCMTEAFEKELADSVLEAALEANKQVLEEWKGNKDMLNH